jgi:TfoX/Sxy family transcriptional regulator of competence genes
MDSLEERIDQNIAGWPEKIVKKKMFSGFGYMLQGNLAFGTHKKDELIVRAGEEQSQALLKKPGIRVFDMTGRPMKNWFMADAEAISSDEKLEELLRTGRDFALSLPPK